MYHELHHNSDRLIMFCRRFDWKNWRLNEFMFRQRYNNLNIDELLYVNAEPHAEYAQDW